MPCSGASKTQERKCVGFSEAFAVKRARRDARRGPHSWIQRKLLVGITIALVSYAYYVYVVTFCIPMIRREDSALGSRRIGVAFIVVFNVLFLMFVWTYGTVVLTSPGYAIQHVSQSPPPAARPQQPVHYEDFISSDEDSVSGTPYNQANHSRSSVGIAPSATSPNSRNLSMTQSRLQSPSQPDGMQAGPMYPIPAVAPVHATGRPSFSGQADGHERHEPTGSASGLPPPLYSRRPPTHPVLSPEYRYCSRDEIIKPMRSHHCRICGTCIMKYDHHCPWIGQCVGAFNQKFFVNFLQWSTALSVYIFVSLLVLIVRTTTRFDVPTINPQHIVVIALSGLFTIFSVSLCQTQMYLIFFNMTTVEQLNVQRMRKREDIVLSDMTPMPCCGSSRDAPELSGIPRSRAPWNVMISRRRILNQWDAEWGKFGREGNLWWLGSKRANWQATMGSSKWGWILPIGRSSGDGLVYPRNPRFDNEGRWRRRTEWPAGLR